MAFYTMYDAPSDRDYCGEEPEPEDPDNIPPQDRTNIGDTDEEPDEPIVCPI